MKTYKCYFLLLAMLMAMPLTVNAEFVGASSSDSVSIEPIVIPPGNGVIPINLDSIREVEIDSLTKVAEQGDVEAQKQLGRIYRYKHYDKQDYKEALKWYRKAAEQGDVEAQRVLGDYYRKGSFFDYDDVDEHDYAEAVKWYRKAAEQGYAIAQEGLGELYYDGSGVKQDYAEAAKWYRKAAEQGYADAQEKLGALYAKGKGVNKDYDEALKWYLKAVDYRSNEGFVSLNYIRDCDILGDLYSAKHDYTEAAKWYRKAADNDKEYFNYISDKSQLKLGLCYAFGKGVKQDFSEATKLIKGWIKGKVKESNEEQGKVPVYLIGSLILLLLILLFFASFYVSKKRFGLFKSAVLAFALTALFFLAMCLLAYIPIIFIDGLPLITSDFLMFFVFSILLILGFGLLVLPALFFEKSIHATSEYETLEDTLMDGKKGHKVRFNKGTYNYISLLVSLLAFLVGIPYYWLITKTLGHEPLSPLSSSIGFKENPPQLIISLLIFAVALILGGIVAILLPRLVWGWRNTRMDWKKGVGEIHCSKPLKKSQFTKGLIAPFFILGLLPLLVSPFVNSFVLCLLGIIFIGATANYLLYVWKLRKEPRDCMIQDIKGESAIFVLDKEQPADKE